MLSRLATALLALYVSGALALKPLEVQGSNFVNPSTNERFEIIGVDYQPGGSAGYNPGSGVDALSNGTVCLRDTALMQILGLNTVRIYNLDPDVNHDECASIFNAAGIYMVIDVNSPLPNESINNAAPWESYNADYLRRVFAIVENFKDYPNLLGFFAANENINDGTTAKTNPQYIRAVVRDIKNYVSAHTSRKIPIGYSAADVRPLLADTAAYFECHLDDDDDDASRIDFFGLNSYSWCGDATYESSTYADLVNLLSKSTVPVFFSEFGCNRVKPRKWSEMGALYGDQMRKVFSGGLAYEFSQETNEFGLVQIHGNTTATLLVDYDNMQDALKKLDIEAVTATNGTATSLKPPTCDADIISDSGISKNFTLPDPPPDVPELISGGVKNAKTGKIQEVRETNVPMAVYATNGGQLQNLAVKVLPNDEVNTPGAATATVGDAPSGTGGSSESSSAAASIFSIEGMGIVAAAGLAVVAAL